MVRNALAGLGFDQDAPMVTFPIDPFLVDSDLAPIAAGADRFVEGLLNWSPRAQSLGMVTPPKVAIEANGFEAALDKLNQRFLVNRWGDGLPVLPATDERVADVMRGTDLAPEHVVGKILPRGGIATVETIAVALAMTGGRPEYLPVLIAALEGLLTPTLDHDKIQATSGSTFPVVVVNGPIAAQIRLNSGFGLLGPDPQHPAGASIGRALRLLMQNVGGALPGVGTMAMFGGMRYTNAVFAEDEAGLPEGWLPLASTRFGVAPGTNSVVVYIATGASNIMRRGVGKEALDEEARQSLHRVASYLGSPNPHYTHGWARGTPGLLLISRVVAKQLASLGWTQAAICKYLWEHSRISQEKIRETGMTQWIEQAPHEDTVASVDMDPWPITRTPDQLLVAVAGGHHPTHNFWMQAYAPDVACKQVHLPSGWETLIAAADQDLGPGGVACVI
ncbi:MAG: hypothetical protein ACI8PT_000087 [Gammaproteobacteria bacterium]